MTGDEMARAYLSKGALRLKVLSMLLKEQGYSDVVREAQELVEIVLKASLRLVGIDPPRWHDVAPVVSEHATAYPPWFREEIDRLVVASAWLREEREVSLYGDVDLVPTQMYTRDRAVTALEDATFVFETVERLLEERSNY